MLYSEPQKVRWSFVRDRNNVVFRVIERQVHAFSTHIILESGEDVNEVDYYPIKHVFTRKKPRKGYRLEGILDEENSISTSPVEEILRKSFDWKNRIRYFLVKTESGSYYSAEVQI